MNNPPAFPSDAVKDPFDRSGMTLRDYFAAKAMQGYLTSQSTWTKKRFVIYAKISYEMADAMMEARDL